MEGFEISSELDGIMNHKDPRSQNNSLRSSGLDPLTERPPLSLCQLSGVYPEYAVNYPEGARSRLWT
ncbi:hypothetical protein Y1Q_0016160 [Alligator mississippiensis]|uniref:Uncharacterized protein n=1 Tax=Alligator mississippiensis TaxID=8496 RepID=A0A151P118_ALLMI|nr:hypothetical protein Y1Q_0016160 [Alligator mississippiensis]